MNSCGVRFESSQRSHSLRHSWYALYRVKQLVGGNWPTENLAVSKKESYNKLRLMMVLYI